MSRKIFDKIQSAALSNDPLYSVDTLPRWLSKLDDSDSLLMANSEVEVVSLGANVFIASITSQDVIFYCFCGLPVPDELPAGLEGVEATPGLFGSVICEADVSSLATAAEANNIMNGRHGKIHGYEGHSVEEVARLFPALFFAKRTAESADIYLSNLERIAGSYISRGYPGRPLDLGSTLQAKFVEMFESGSDTVPYHLVLQSILSYRWSDMYLDLYRCLEQLYSAPRLMDLATRIRHEGTLAELASILEDTLTWRPKEEEALASILNKITPGTRLAILQVFTEAMEVLPESSERKCAKHIYRLRNEHVHYRPAMKAGQRDSSAWARIVFVMCDAVLELYDRLGVGFLNTIRPAEARA
ncbi:hypothetical protein HU745_02445 [Pseudomonas mosselii]|uniref:hypothetical protein n=1 Tax=Pseudomonas mosselii TaxID=78327 RepID=UPI001647DA9D|nr:hypothetical protein [Pseudomonas mosselii]MBC3449902.1 hypothetical protein [Pseudomonas mosselii]